ncbi:hypothetical protein LZP81_31030 [Streptomyces parvulus]|uniref:hypothetical protein n=1 Tax=Streptomyces parvulus TaxID=146923 RepID=UPI001E47A095|nr:hypothetical protein [Streptomyces parvulus]MCC9154862.1 hypothetical protein [Streptomyces parvulus]MCE7691293.1 hypothetical protein [Streptomyces parvulus]
MSTPPFIRRLRTPRQDARNVLLRAELARERDLTRALLGRIDGLQHANESAYHLLSIERGVACHKTNCPWCPAKDGAA